MKFADFHNTKLAEASKTRNPTRDYLRNNPVSPDQMAKPVKQMSVPDLATVSDEALDNAYHYGRSTPGNTFGWQANLKSAAYAKQMIDKGVTDIEQISDAIHKGWNITARAFVQNPDQFDDTEKLKAAGKLEAKLQQRAKLMNIEYAQLPDDEQEKDRVVARALLQAIKGQQGVAEASDTMQRYGRKIQQRVKAARAAEPEPKKEEPQAPSDISSISTRDLMQQLRKPKKQGVAEGLEDSAAQQAIIDTVERLFRKNDIGDYNSLEAVRQGVKHHFSKPGATVESAIDGILNILTKRMSKLYFRFDLGRFKEALRRGIAHQLKKQGVAEAKADPLGAWIAHKNGTEARKFKTREGAKKYVASHDGFTVSSSEAFHDTYRKKKVQEVKKFRTTYGWAGGSKEPRSAHAKQVAAKRKEYEKGLGKFEPTDNMVGTAKVTKGVAEGWKDLAVGGAMALGALGAGHAQAADLSNFNTQYLQQVASGEHPRPMVSIDDAKAELQARANGKQQSVTTPAKSEEPKGFSKEYLQKAADPNRFGRYMISIEKAQELLNNMKEGVAEEYNPEYDDEAGMADNNLSTLRRAVDGLDDLIDTGDNLPEWCQEKIAVAKSMLVTVWNYMESEDDVMAEGEKWIQKAVKPKTKGDLHKALHVPQDETIPKSRIAQAIHSADPHLRHMAQFAKNVAKEDAGGMGTGSVATSMGAGNGFANGGPGTITRRRK